jgi:NAD(P)-dependent dehydrogenase (short-subunit alcohol dehydrogenase family)
VTAGGIAASNNTDHDGMEAFLAYIRNPPNGFTAAIFTGGKRGIALVTGGNSGIGLATARQFVNEGAYVFKTGRRVPELAAATKETGKNVAGVEGDVSNLGDLDRLFAQIEREKGKLDIVFANSGFLAVRYDGEKI